ncbi:hypothetical protein [Burkholderia ambifaria]|uniref:hypothetical protein n=1 Tax=Burkholderia ambifaria TaxID=152480 RepID=UPI001ABB4435|nr:hypothetical protein [Burkholderia ambifaria]
MQEEQFLIRDRAYSVWHRTRSISRFIGTDEAKALTVADLNSMLFVEFGCSSKLPLALAKAAQDIEGNRCDPGSIWHHLQIQPLAVCQAVGFLGRLGLADLHLGQRGSALRHGVGGVEACPKKMSPS